MKVVINDCFGGFGLSPAALLALHKRNAHCLQAHSVEEYFKGSNFRTLEESLQIWRAFKDGAKEDLFLNVFTPDEKFILHCDRGDEIRNDPDLVAVVEELGEAANGRFADLKVVEIPDDVQWHIHEYDGTEYVAENHRTWG